MHDATVLKKSQSQMAEVSVSGSCFSVCHVESMGDGGPRALARAPASALARP